MAEERVLSPEQQAKLAAAHSGTKTQLAQVRDSLNPDPGQYDMLFTEFTPNIAENGMYVLDVTVKFTGPAKVVNDTPAGKFKRTLYIGNKKDPMAELPDTRFNNRTISWLKKCLKANDLPTNTEQSVDEMCRALLNKQVSCRIDGRPYDVKNADGTVKTENGKPVQGTSYDFGNNPVKVGAIPARLDKDAATGGAAATAAAPAAGFGE